VGYEEERGGRWLPFACQETLLSLSLSLSRHSSWIKYVPVHYGIRFRGKCCRKVNECGEIGEPSVILSSYLRDIYIHGLNRQKYGGLIGPNGSLAGSNQSDII
jgi:hypothetical protein